MAKGEQPRWRGDGRELFLYTDPTGISAVDVKVENDLATGVPHVVLSIPTLAIGSGTFFRFDVARDGQSFLVRERDQAVAMQESLQMIVNWPSLLSK